MAKNTSTTAPIGVIILAAGLGKRMKSTLPKVLHEIGGQPLLFHILDKVFETAPQASVAIVVGHAREKVEAAVHANPNYQGHDLHFIHQAEQRGTGHAARCAMDSEWGSQMVSRKAEILVLPGDLPLIPMELIRQMLVPLGRTDTMRLLSCELPDPTGYGRIVRRGKSGPVLRIVEQKDANPRERAIREVVASIYSYQSLFLKSALSRLSNKNAQGEYYLTDVVAFATRAKKRVDVLIWENPEDVRGVNDPWELSQAGRILNDRIVRFWALEGVRFMDPSTTWIDPSVRLAEEVVVHPGVLLRGKTRVARGVVLGPNVILKNMEIGEGANVKAGTVGDDSVIGPGAQVGPYAHFRPESKVGRDSKVGNFVELKKASVGEHTSIAHLSYVGDAEIGSHVNIGCGFVTCNFDGRVIDGQRKHKTIIEDDVFLGSDCQTIAPVRIGRGAYVASGSTITENVESEALAIARSRQVNKPGYAKKLKGK
ncbi:MAG: bifunctional UDP-N-acetylglucosamine diphosphorylase/glucosamine-1-phosphate N-acetyltransferase GlmU [Bdellovibrionota bacterium]